MKYENGEIKIDAWELIQYLPKEKLLEFIETFACHDVVIKHVTDQILEGWTENMNCGSTDYPARAEPQCPLNQARRAILKHYIEYGNEEIGALESALKIREEEVKSLNTENNKLRERNRELSNMLFR